jgi:D-alanyl-D-alanine carboxypeptidase (penicillin-binding protein 5/6)
MPTSRDRSEEGVRLMGWAFAQFEDVTLFTAADTVENARVYLGAQPTVPLVAGHDVVITMPRSWRQTAKVTVDYQAPVQAPVARGQVIGKLTVAGQGVPSTEIPLLAGADVPRLSLPGRALAVLSHYVTGS